MLNFKKIIVSLLFTCCFTVGFSQSNPFRLLYNYKWDVHHFKKAKDQKKWHEFEMFSRMYSRYAAPEEKTLPLVFNIIHIQNNVKVTEATVIEQMAIVNQAFEGDFSSNYSGFYAPIVAGDTKLRFCLGTPQGNNPWIKFKHRNTAYTLEELSLIVDKKEGLEGAKKDEYINVWITELPDEMGGLTFLPDHEDAIDGIVIDPDYFGLKPQNALYNEGKTIVFLLGQYLGLKPLWTDLQCSDDGVEDTPIHNGPNYYCFPYSHVSLCSGNPEEMIGNYMDATPDECTYMFTKGQMARMHATIGDYGYRKKLLDSNKLCDNNYKSEIVAENRNDVLELNFTIVPNPASNAIDINFENPQKDKSVKIDIYNLSGQIVKEIEIPPLGENKGGVNIDISNLNIGSYIVRLSSDNKIKTKNFIKN